MRDTPDQELKAAMVEIKAIMGRYDIAGYIELHGKDSVEYEMILEPSWSCMTVTESNRNGPAEIRFRAKMKTGTEEEKERGKMTAGLILAMARCAAFHLGQCATIAAMLKNHMDAELIMKEV